MGLPGEAGRVSCGVDGALEPIDGAGCTSTDDGESQEENSCRRVIVVVVVKTMIEMEGSGGVKGLR